MEDIRVFYLCDGRACDKCSNPFGMKDRCRFTSDIRHAKNFKVSALEGTFFENNDGGSCVVNFGGERDGWTKEPTNETEGRAGLTSCPHSRRRL